MKILLFGVSNVGKTTIGTMLAKEPGYSYNDLDEEIKKEFQMLFLQSTCNIMNISVDT